MRPGAARRARCAVVRDAAGAGSLGGDSSPCHVLTPPRAAGLAEPMALGLDDDSDEELQVLEGGRTGLLHVANRFTLLRKLWQRVAT